MTGTWSRTPPSTRSRSMDGFVRGSLSPRTRTSRPYARPRSRRTRSWRPWVAASPRRSSSCRANLSTSSSEERRPRAVVRGASSEDRHAAPSWTIPASGGVQADLRGQFGQHRIEQCLGFRHRYRVVAENLQRDVSVQACPELDHHVRGYEIQRALLNIHSCRREDV